MSETPGQAVLDKGKSVPRVVGIQEKPQLREICLG